MWLMQWKCWFYIFNSYLLLIGNNKKELVPNGFCFSFVFDFKRTWIWKRILLSSLVYALKKVFNELEESSSFGGDFSGRYHVYFVFDLLNKLTKQRSASAVLDNIKREKYSENVPRKFVCNSSPEVMPPIFFSREPEREIQHFCPPLRLPCSLILFLALTVPPLASPPKTYAIIAERYAASGEPFKLSNSSFFYASI